MLSLVARLTEGIDPGHRVGVQGVNSPAVHAVCAHGVKGKHKYAFKGICIDVRSLISSSVSAWHDALDPIM